MRHLSKIFAAAILAIPLTLPLLALAAPNNASGEIHFDKDPRKVDSFSVTQDNSIEYIKNLANEVQQAKAGTVPAAFSIPSDEITTYLNSAYLYCTVKAGVCPSILDSLLEVDVINARLSKKAECPVLKKFWQLWVRSDMEKRMQYQVQTGYLTANETFRKTERPKYIRCEETVQTAINGFSNDSEYFKDRYSGESPQKKAVEFSVKLLEQIKLKVPNVIAEVGAR